MESCQPGRESAPASRPFQVVAYAPDDSGRWAPVAIPTNCPVGARARECHIGIDHHRARKTGPRVPVVVVACSTHKCRFTRVLPASLRRPPPRPTGGAAPPTGLGAPLWAAAAPSAPSSIDLPPGTWLTPPPPASLQRRRRSQIPALLPRPRLARPARRLGALGVRPGGPASDGVPKAETLGAERRPVGCSRLQRRRASQRALELRCGSHFGRERCLVVPGHPVAGP
jgi:hypothetical protein